jgi:hypothetical protein
LSNKLPAVGNRVRDPVTGIEGIAVGLVERLHGESALILQPKSPDGIAYPDPFNFDISTLEFVDDGMIDRVVTPDHCPVALGEHVTDNATFFEGFVVERVTTMNGCVHLTIAAPINEDGDTKRHHVDWKRVRRNGHSIENNPGVQPYRPDNVGANPYVEVDTQGIEGEILVNLTGQVDIPAPTPVLRQPTGPLPERGPQMLWGRGGFRGIRTRI